MRSSDMDGATNGGGGGFVMGMLCGAAVGAALGLLLAPKPGAEMRNDLKRSANDLSRRAKKVYDGAAGTISDMANRGVNAMNDLDQPTV